jgi:hypothetical protein
MSLGDLDAQFTRKHARTCLPVRESLICIKSVGVDAPAPLSGAFFFVKKEGVTTACSHVHVIHMYECMNKQVCTCT